MNSEQEIKAEMLQRIVDFIGSNTCLTLSTCKDNIPYSASCFYAFIPSINALVIKSKQSTTHIDQAINNKHISGTIHPDNLQKTKIRGIQFTGMMDDSIDNDVAKKAYYSKYPFARVVPGSIWIIKLEEIKMTDNTLGFAEKIKWNSHG